MKTLVASGLLVWAVAVANRATAHSAGDMGSRSGATNSASRKRSAKRNLPFLPLLREYADLEHAPGDGQRLPTRGAAAEARRAALRVRGGALDPRGSRGKREKEGSESAEEKEAAGEDGPEGDSSILGEILFFQFALSLET